MMKCIKQLVAPFAALKILTSTKENTLAVSGSSHTFYRYIWPIALSIQGLTTTDKAEKKYLLDQLVACDGGTGVMHESFP